ncbi:MAG: HDIG domain-containing protein [Deltaproteobacteria bacterium]|nr:HDIG domain-containing protein [Deltaproteobacteria bacterium]HPW68629.1 HDIG domain-containing protein [Deltaproteobacteria bacterium]
MTAYVPSRDDALSLLLAHTKTDQLQKHAYAVEAVMRYLARKAGEDEDTWGVIGLVHDLDYEQYPDQHCTKTREILEQHGWPEDYIRAVVSHGWGICSDAEPISRLEKTLYAIDELTGLVAASALVRPSKSVMDLTTKSVMKKWKSPAFAAGVDRSIIAKGAEMLNMEVSALVEDTIMGMREAAQEIGLKGEG